MKFKVTMKTPDALDDAIRETVVREIGMYSSPDIEEFKYVVEDRCNEVKETCKRWFEYGEYVTIEIDTDAGTAIVVETRQ